MVRCQVRKTFLHIEFDTEPESDAAEKKRSSSLPPDDTGKPKEEENDEYQEYLRQVPMRAAWLGRSSQYDVVEDTPLSHDKSDVSEDSELGREYVPSTAPPSMTEGSFDGGEKFNGFKDSRNVKGASNEFISSLDTASSNVAPNPVLMSSALPLASNFQDSDFYCMREPVHTPTRFESRLPTPTSIPWPARHSQQASSCRSPSPDSSGWGVGSSTQEFNSCQFPTPSSTCWDATRPQQECNSCQFPTPSSTCWDATRPQQVPFEQGREFSHPCPGYHVQSAPSSTCPDCDDGGFNLRREQGRMPETIACHTQSQHVEWPRQQNEQQQQKQQSQTNMGTMQHGPFAVCSDDTRPGPFSQTRRVDITRFISSSSNGSFSNGRASTRILTQGDDGGFNLRREHGRMPETTACHTQSQHVEWPRQQNEQQQQTQQRQANMGTMQHGPFAVCSDDTRPGPFSQSRRVDISRFISSSSSNGSFSNGRVTTRKLTQAARSDVSTSYSYDGFDEVPGGDSSKAGWFQPVGNHPGWTSCPPRHVEMTGCSQEQDVQILHEEIDAAESRAANAEMRAKDEEIRNLLQRIDITEQRAAKAEMLAKKEQEIRELTQKLAAAEQRATEAEMRAKDKAWHHDWQHEPLQWDNSSGSNDMRCPIQGCPSEGPWCDGYDVQFDEAGATWQQPPMTWQRQHSVRYPPHPSHPQAGSTAAFNQAVPMVQQHPHHLRQQRRSGMQHVPYTQHPQQMQQIQGDATALNQQAFVPPSLGSITDESYTDMGLLIDPEKATTLMLHDIPCRIKQDSIERMLTSLGFAGKYDFVWLPVRSRAANFGYAFVNFGSPEIAQEFAKVFPLYEFRGSNSVKSGGSRPAQTQGREANLKRFPRSRRANSHLAPLSQLQ